MKLKHGRHAVYALTVHLIFVCKRRGKVFERQHLDRLQAIFAKVCADFETELIEFNGEQDHVHLLLNHPPKVCVSALVNSLKRVSSRRLKQAFPELKQFWSIGKRAGALWSPSYFAASVGGAPVAVLRQYIEQQQSLD
jgi:putative transposase